MKPLARAARGWLAAVIFAAVAFGFGVVAHAQPGGGTQGRVLTAIVRNNTVLVPLRSMFEQTGVSRVSAPRKIRDA